MNQKGFTNILLIILTIIIIGGIIGGIAGSSVSFQGSESALITTTPPTSDNLNGAQPTVIPTLSEDRKSIVADGKILLVVDNDSIINFFKTKSQLCDEYNITTTPDRKMFCENKEAFGSMTRFTSIVVSPDKMKVGFTIESDTLSPDKVVGIFYPSRTTNKINFLTNYYLGNKFISFSPSGINFVYQGNCWEGMCGLFIKNSETLAKKVNLNNPEYADFKSENSEFVRWVSDTEVVYKLGEELKQESF